MPNILLDRNKNNSTQSLLSQPTNLDDLNPPVQQQRTVFNPVGDASSLDFQGASLEELLR